MSVDYVTILLSIFCHCTAAAEQYIFLTHCTSLWYHLFPKHYQHYTRAHTHTHTHKTIFSTAFLNFLGVDHGALLPHLPATQPVTQTREGGGDGGGEAKADGGEGGGESTAEAGAAAGAAAGGEQTVDVPSAVDEDDNDVF